MSGLWRQPRVRAAARRNGARSVSQGYVCYKPAERRACYLRTMDAWDRQTLQPALSASGQRVSERLPGVAGQTGR